MEIYPYPELLPKSEDLFTSSVSFDSRVEAWKEYTGFNCIIYTTMEEEHAIQTNFFV